MQYYEDIFVLFFDAIKYDMANWPQHEQNAIFNFYSIITNNSQLTEKQANFVVKLLSKYQTDASLKYFCEYDLDNASWKNKFRTIDYTKTIFVEVNNNKTCICLKFPFVFKQTFDQHFSEMLSHDLNNQWDAERKLRVISPYEINLLQLNEFVHQHGFTIENSFLDLIAEYEEIVNEQDNVIPGYKLDKNEIVLLNCPDDTKMFFDQHKRADTDANRILLKTMGLIQYDQNIKNDLDRIASTSATHYYLHNDERFFNIVNKTIGKVIVVINEEENSYLWLENFYSAFLKYSKNKILKIGFREKNNSFVNEFVHKNKLGGDLETADIIIFKEKIPKWIFTKKIDIDILCTNNNIPYAKRLLANYFESSPFVIHISEYKPVIRRNKNIVHL